MGPSETLWLLYTARALKILNSGDSCHIVIGTHQRGAMRASRAPMPMPRVACVPPPSAEEGDTRLPLDAVSASAAVHPSWGDPAFLREPRRILQPYPVLSQLSDSRRTDYSPLWLMEAV